MSVRIEDRTSPGPASLTGLPRNADQLTKHAVTPSGWPLAEGAPLAAAGRGNLCAFADLCAELKQS